jgi:hypothetical protein
MEGGKGDRLLSCPVDGRDSREIVSVTGRLRDYHPTTDNCARNHHRLRMNTATLSPTSPKVKRKQSGRKRAPSHIAPQQTQETHDAALYSIRAFLRSRTSYDAFPVSFRLIVLDSQLEVKKALQCLLLNGGHTRDLASHQKRLTFLSQASFLPPFGTARNQCLLGCSQFLISSI